MNIPFKNFTQFRPGQQEVIELALKSNKRFIMISAPCGTGKSLEGMCLCSYYQPSTYLVATKMLQEQLQSDFPEAKVLAGRNNYDCLRFYELELKADHCIKKGCHYISGCPYENAKQDALKNPYKVLNHSYYLNEVNHGSGKFKNQKLLILDEADQLESTLTDFISLVLTKGNIRYLAEHSLSEPEYKTKPETWQLWADRCMKNILSKINALKDLLAVSNPTTYAIRQYSSLTRLYEKFKTLKAFSSDRWIRFEYEGKIIYRPIWLDSDLTSKFLFNHSEKFILMSATFPNFYIYCKLMGLDPGEVELIELPHPFPVESRRVIYEDVADMSYKNFEIGKLIARVRDILYKHESEKGIIHTASYKVRDQIMSLMDNRLITHDTADKEKVIREFKKSDKPQVLVSPSIIRGVSFDDDEARFIIWCKVPFSDINDRVVSARLYGSKDFGRLWYLADAATKIVQGSSRATRSENDFSVTYILDSQFTKLLQKPQLFPKWFREALTL